MLHFAWILHFMHHNRNISNFITGIFGGFTFNILQIYFLDKMIESHLLIMKRIYKVSGLDVSFQDVHENINQIGFFQ